MGHFRPYDAAQPCVCACPSTLTCSVVPLGCVAQLTQPTCFLLAVSSPVFGPQQVYGLLNGSVTVKCFYPPTKVNRHDRKYWCRESSTRCITVVSTSGYVAPGYQGRVSITDYPVAQNFQINISNLALADTGTYQCGIGINGRGLSHKVNLDVSKGNYSLGAPYSSFTSPSLFNEAPQIARPVSKSSRCSTLSGNSFPFPLCSYRMNSLTKNLA